LQKGHCNGPYNAYDVELEMMLRGPSSKLEMMLRGPSSKLETKIIGFWFLPHA
jgi:hypothetical protein